MLILINGTPKSGKSQMAEKLATGLSEDNTKYYIATMIPFDDEGLERIKKHRSMRQGKGFVTLEWPSGIEKRLKETHLEKTGTVLLECMSNLVGNEMHNDANNGKSIAELTDMLIQSVRLLNDAVENLVVVTNSFEEKADEYDEQTLNYVKLTQNVNAQLEIIADRVYEKQEVTWVVKRI